jgi:hypothetical protein
MELIIRRAATGERLFSIQSGSRTQFGLQPFELKQQLLDLGIGDSTIATTLDLGPDESIIVKVAEKAA